MYQIKDISRYPGYRADSNGDIWSCWSWGCKYTHQTNEWHKLKQGTLLNGRYRVVSIKRRPRTVHSLVLEAFHGVRPKGMEACHNNGISTDNRLENLRWDTPKKNNLDKRHHGTHLYGEKMGNAIFTEKQVRVIKWALHYGASITYLQNVFKVSKSAIQNIKNGHTWSYVKVSI